MEDFPYYETDDDTDELIEDDFSNVQRLGLSGLRRQLDRRSAMLAEAFPKAETSRKHLKRIGAAVGTAALFGVGATLGARLARHA